MLVFGLILCFPTMSLIFQFPNTIYNGSYSWAYHICKCHAHGPQVGLLIILSLSWVNFSDIDFPTFSSFLFFFFFFFNYMPLHFFLGNQSEHVIILWLVSSNLIRLGLIWLQVLGINNCNKYCWLWGFYLKE